MHCATYHHEYGLLFHWRVLEGCLHRLLVLRVLDRVLLERLVGCRLEVVHEGLQGHLQVVIEGLLELLLLAGLGDLVEQVVHVLVVQAAAATASTAGHNELDLVLQWSEGGEGRGRVVSVATGGARCACRSS